LIVCLIDLGVPFHQRPQVPAYHTASYPSTGLPSWFLYSAIRDYSKHWSDHWQ